MDKQEKRKVMIGFMKALESVTPITKELVWTLKQLTLEELQDCVETPSKSFPHFHAINCRKLYDKYLKPKAEMVSKN